MERKLKIAQLFERHPELEEIYGLARVAFEASRDPAHDLYHVVRVTENAVEIALGEDESLETAALAALLHDIKRPSEDIDGLDHAAEGGKYSLKLLLSMGYTYDIASEVALSIRDHRFSSGKEPGSATGKILQDADRLDAIGAIAIARVFSYSGKVGRPLHSPDLSPRDRYEGFSASAINHFYEKILKITPESFWTGTGRELARERYEFTVAFVERFLEEW
ncbi:MAG TPA: HD domain-containing protein [Mesotoga sp.]|nr:HD domain-containing protein [Mesotoga sp.]HQQ55995.1 HD domain-containing protein [Mesotoga sp.]